MEDFKLQNKIYCNLNECGIYIDLSGQPLVSAVEHCLVSFGDWVVEAIYTVASGNIYLFSRFNYPKDDVDGYLNIEFDSLEDIIDFIFD